MHPRTIDPGPIPEHPGDARLNDYLDGVLGAKEQTDVAWHLERCAECALLVAQLQHIVRDARALPALQPPPAVWERIRAETQDSGLRAQGSRQDVGRVSPVHAARPAVRTPYWALATAAAIVLAFLAGRAIEQRHQQDAVAQIHVPAVAPDQDNVNSVSNMRERVLLMAVGDHLERSQMVLVELANAQTLGQLDISTERQAADELLASNRLYRQTAVQLGQANVAGVLDELERVLVEVARGPSQVSMAQLAEIQQRIDAQGILFKMKIVNSTITGRKAPVS